MAIMKAPALAVLLAADGEAGGVGPFSVNFGLTLWTLIVFAIFLYFFRKTFWTTIVSRAEEREKAIGKRLADAEQANAKAQALVDQHAKLVADSRAQAQALLAEAKVTAEKERAAALQKTRQEQEALLDRARRDIAAERDKAAVELRREAVDLALSAAARLIGQRLDSDADRKLVLDYLAKVETIH
jgi:F-type H+-transporting ATPase subunit b